MPHCSGAVMAIGGLKWSLWGRLDHLYMMLSLCCQIDKKMLEWTSVISYPASLSLFQGNNVPNFLSWTATTPFLAMQVDWEWLHPQLQWWAGPSLAKPRSLVQDGHMTILTSGQSDVRKHLLGPSEKEALCSLENATKWYVLSSYCSRSYWQSSFNPEDSQPEEGADIMCSTEDRWRVNWALGDVEPCPKPDQSLEFQLAEIINSLYI